MQDGPGPELGAPYDRRTLNVAIFSRYASVRAGLATILSRDPSIRITAEAGSSADITKLTEAHSVDAAVLDVEGPEIHDALESLRRSSVPAVILVDGADSIPPHVMAGLPGWAVLSRAADEEQILAAVRAAAVGLAVTDASVATLQQSASMTGGNSEVEALTSREREILQLMAQGLPNKGIAARLNISPHTVKFHIASVMAKLGAGSRTEAVAIGARRGDVKL